VPPFDQNTVFRPVIWIGYVLANRLVEPSATLIVIPAGTAVVFWKSSAKLMIGDMVMVLVSPAPSATLWVAGEPYDGRSIDTWRLVGPPPFFRVMLASGCRDDVITCEI
jgi:hypothetical protein